MSDFVIENGVLKKYTGEGGDVVIPEGVTAIGNLAFSYCKNLQSIVIPEGVTKIGREAFEDCTNLQSIVIPESVNEIGDFAFISCSNLQSVVIPEGVAEIRYRIECRNNIRSERIICFLVTVQPCCEFSADIQLISQFH